VSARTAEFDLLTNRYLAPQRSHDYQIKSKMQTWEHARDE